ncbi:MAG: hypothetical protein GXO40_01435 [Epsilonproteobacteria bacterium]|nr:hypothetical protein [Campylobacterota bacterium]
MKIIIAAFYKEVSFLISHYNLKKQNTPFEIFANEQLAVVISGMGKINAAMATTYACAIFDVEFIINFGIAGSSVHAIGEIFLINKINANLYPDILFYHPFRESGIICSDTVVTKGQIELVDMESEGFFVSASKFVLLGNIFVIKVVSDNLACFRPIDGFFEQLFAPISKDIIGFIDSLASKTVQLYDQEYLEYLAKRYKLSKSQREILKNKLIYANLNNQPIHINHPPSQNRKNDFAKILQAFKS